MKRRIIPVEQRFWEKVEKTKTCWNWTSAFNQKGYGVFNLNGKAVKAHRFAYELLKSKIPKGLTLDHICRNRGCVNPNHLECLTHKENILKGIGLSAINARKTHCDSGHPLTGKNLYFKSGRRFCRECRRNYKPKWIKLNPEKVKEHEKRSRAKRRIVKT